MGYIRRYDRNARPIRWSCSDTTTTAQPLAVRLSAELLAGG